MICGLEIGMLIFRIMTLVKGSFNYSKTGAVKGPMAYVIGVVLLLPLPIAFTIGLLIGVMKAANHETIDTGGISLTLMELGVVLAVGALVAILTAVAPKTDREPTWRPQAPAPTPPPLPRVPAKMPTYQPPLSSDEPPR